MVNVLINAELEPHDQFTLEDKRRSLQWLAQTMEVYAYSWPDAWSLVGALQASIEALDRGHAVPLSTIPPVSNLPQPMPAV